MHEVPFNLLGISLKLQTDDDPKKLIEAIAYLEKQVEEVRKTFEIQDSIKILMVAALKLSEEALSLHPYSDHELERWTKRLIDHIDEVL